MRSRTIYVDGHVHIYPGMGLQAAIDCAASNLRRVATPAPTQGVLILADPDGVDGFERLCAARSMHGVLTGWTVGEPSPQFVMLEHHSGVALAVLRSRQLVTREGLEVIVTGARSRLSSGASLASTLDEARASGGWATIPWGAGKWLGRRGRLVSAAIATEAARAGIVIGDNGGRPRGWSYVPQFRAAADNGIPILAGSDPLPIAGDERRIASYGSIVTLSASLAIDAALREAMLESRARIVTAGRRIGAWQFARSQWALRNVARRP
jgi:hypothetical protein